MTIDELEARMDPADAAEAKRLADEAPPPGPNQQAILLGLFGYLPRSPAAGGKA